MAWPIRIEYSDAINHAKAEDQYGQAVFGISLNRREHG